MTGRDERGRFTEKNPGGGRKPAEFRTEAKRAICKHITEDELAKLIADCARRKMPWAIKIAAEYIWGVPVQPVDVTTNGESVNFSIQAVDYRTGMDALAPGPVGDSNAPGQDEGSDSGTSVG